MRVVMASSLTVRRAASKASGSGGESPRTEAGVEECRGRLAKDESGGVGRFPAYTNLQEAEMHPHLRWGGGAPVPSPACSFTTPATQWPMAGAVRVASAPPVIVSRRPHSPVAMLIQRAACRPGVAGRSNPPEPPSVK